MSVTGSPRRKGRSLLCATAAGRLGPPRAVDPGQPAGRRAPTHSPPSPREHRVAAPASCPSAVLPAALRGSSR
ncbi:hypothetical protein NN561_010295 [Cricetulus griseus]